MPLTTARSLDAPVVERLCDGAHRLPGKRGHDRLQGSLQPLLLQLQLFLLQLILLVLEVRL
jgi:hypothetical protein